PKYQTYPAEPLPSISMVGPKRPHTQAILARPCFPFFSRRQQKRFVGTRLPHPGGRREAQLVLLAMGFVHPVHEGLLKMPGVDLDQRGNVRANMVDDQTSRPNVFSAGDMQRGQSLVV